MMIRALHISADTISKGDLWLLLAVESDELEAAFSLHKARLLNLSVAGANFVLKGSVGHCMNAGSFIAESLQVAVGEKVAEVRLALLQPP
ncbi:hypothetical protein NL676_039165 [Syzygium grande]|nr:hypothetical protein NL676_039165 [Syzygium grande]